jgi:hypothetical protein
MNYGTRWSQREQSTNCGYAPCSAGSFATVREYCAY